MLGETIGNFRVIGCLGRGGMGEVFLGEQVSIQTRVAIKILHREISADREHVQRFFNEARIVSRIKHAGVVKIFDVGFHNEHAYLVMELLEGESLARRIERLGRFSATQIADLCRQIASTLAAAHASGVVHRDLKPDNVFLTTDHDLGDRERVKLLDFGIAKLTGTLGASSPRTVGTMGTPAYMAPEQWGNSANVDWRADAYSLGCVAFEMACGRPPFEITTIADACAQHLHTVPPAARSLSPDLPIALDQLITRLLAKDPAARGTSMSEIARTFEECGGGEHDRPPLAATLATTSPPTPRPAARTTLGGSTGELAQTASPRRWQLFGGALLVATLGTIGVMVARSGTASDDGATMPAAPPVATHREPAPAPPDATVAQTSDMLDANVAATSVDAAAQATSIATRPPPTSSTKPPKPRTNVPRTGTGSSKAPTSCDPPYVVDGTGKRIYKKECL